MKIVNMRPPHARPDPDDQQTWQLWSLSMPAGWQALGPLATWTASWGRARENISQHGGSYLVLPAHQQPIPEDVPFTVQHDLNLYLPREGLSDN